MNKLIYKKIHNWLMEKYLEFTLVITTSIIVGYFMSYKHSFAVTNMYEFMAMILAIICGIGAVYYWGAGIISNNKRKKLIRLSIFKSTFFILILVIVSWIPVLMLIWLFTWMTKQFTQNFYLVILIPSIASVFVTLYIFWTRQIEQKIYDFIKNV